MNRVPLISKKSMPLVIGYDVSFKKKHIDITATLTGTTMKIHFDHIPLLIEALKSVRRRRLSHEKASLCRTSSSCESLKNEKQHSGPDRRLNGNKKRPAAGTHLSQKSSGE
jgi:hypothetical protein